MVFVIDAVGKGVLNFQLKVFVERLLSRRADSRLFHTVG